MRMLVALYLIGWALALMPKKHPERIIWAIAINVAATKCQEKST